MANGSDAAFLILGLCAVVSTIAAWWQFGRLNPPLASRQEVSTFIGLLALSFLLVFPFAYAFSLPLQRELPWQYVVFGSWGLSVLAIVAGAFGLKQVRFPLIFGALSICLVLVMIPAGVL
jgi:hypothetical protein